MDIEKEITVLVKTSYENLKKELVRNNFVLKEEYTVNDIYLINKNLALNEMDSLDVLKKCVLIRDVVNIEKVLLYKYKKYADDGSIIEQGKIKCPIFDVAKAQSFMEAIGYKKIFNINDNCKVYVNSKTELVVQIVNDKYVFIEMEDKPEYLDKEYDDINSMKDELLSYNLSIDKNNFYVKKAQMILNEVLNNNMSS